MPPRPPTRSRPAPAAEPAAPTPSDPAAMQRLLGIGVCVLAVGLIALAAAVAWSGAQRWQAVEETRQAALLLRRDRPAEARAYAARAAARVPDEAAPALLATDLASADAAPRLQALALRCAPADRPVVDAALGLANILNRRPPGVDLAGTGDGRLLDAAWTAVGGRDPDLREGGMDERPPQHQVLRAALIILLRQAWQAGKATEAAGLARTLLLLRPRAPEAPVLRLLAAAERAATPDAEVVHFAEALKDERMETLRALCALVPARRTALAARWPELAAGGKP